MTVVTSINKEEHVILRYRRTQRSVHFLLASSFVLLLLTGLVLLWDPLGFLAAGGASRMIHRFGAVLFIAVPLVYLVTDREGAKELVYDSFHFDKDDRAWLVHIIPYVLGHAEEMPPAGRLNAGQKLHHAAVILISATVVVSGLLLWFFKSSLGETGLAWVVVAHDISMLLLTLFLVGHLYFTYVYKAISGMTTGWVEEVDARLEHPKWVAELEAEAAASASSEGEQPPHDAE
ncbi:MAG: cytochrome b/b6 domain-containing protein [Actinomycetota bacterium]|nr:cytochrome b/b6 domain-containing protein [Actinomycetota bacterium]